MSNGNKLYILSDVFPSKTWILETQISILRVLCGQFERIMIVNYMWLGYNKGGKCEQR